MSEIGDRDPKRAIQFSLVMAAVLLIAFAYLVFGEKSWPEGEFATFGALIAIPFCAGALFTHSAKSYSALGCLVAPIVLGVICYSLVALGLEGFICVAMVMPIWTVAGLGGGLTTLLSRGWMAERTDGETKTLAIGLAALPFALIYAEAAAPPAWQTREVTRSAIVDAPAQTVWPMLVSIPDISQDEGIANPTQDWLHIPRPTSAELVERDGKFVRLARWGEHIRFEEIITHMREEETVSWRFAFPDNSVQEHTDRHISPEGEMLKIETGRYDLVELADGRTKITLTTRYRMRTRLGWYMAWWGEQLLGDVQDNVLAIVKNRAEAP